VAHPPGRVTPGSALLDRTPGGCADDDDVSAFPPAPSWPPVSCLACRLRR